MRPPLKLRNFFEQNFPDATSYGLETRRRSADGESLDGWRVETSWQELIDHHTSAETVFKATLDFLEECPSCPYRAFIRVPKEVSPDGRLRCEFAIPGGGNLNPYPINVAEVMKESGMAQDAPGSALMNFVLGFARADADRAEAQLEAAREREGQLFGSITGLIEETREDRKMFLQETRKDRQAHDERLEPLLAVAVSTLTASAELVKIHQDSNTQVQLAKLQHEAEKEKWDMAAELGIPMLKGVLTKFKKRKKKQPSPTSPTMPIDTDQEDAPPPDTGPTRTLFMIIEQLSDEQIEKVTEVLPEGMFERLDTAAHSGDDAKTTVALGELKGAYEKLGKLKGLAKMLEIGEVLGDELSEKFIALFQTEDALEPTPEPEQTDDEDEDDEDATEPIDTAKLAAQRSKTGYVKGLRSIKLHQLDEAEQVKLAEQLGGPLTGILIGAAESDDEDKAFIALCNLGARIQEFAEEHGQDETEKRLQTVLDILGDEDEKLFELVGTAADELGE